MAPMLETLAIVHGVALAVLLIAARFSVRLVDEQGRPMARARKQPEPNAGEPPDPTAHPQGRAPKPNPSWLA